MVEDLGQHFLGNATDGKSVTDIYKYCVTYSQRLQWLAEATTGKKGLYTAEKILSLHIAMIKRKLSMTLQRTLTQKISILLKKYLVVNYLWTDNDAQANIVSVHL